jgi:peptide alpha-N-acetyltransferase
LQYKDEHDLPIVMDLIDKSLSEPYSVFTYRYFLHQWPNLCYLAFDGDKAIGVVVCKMDDHRGHLRGYIAMLVVDNTYRGKGLGRCSSWDASSTHVNSVPCRGASKQRI